MDLQEKPESRPVTLADTRRALMAGAVTVHEARVHAALVLSPDLLGLSAIEASSGLGRMVLTGDPRRGTPGVIPAEGQSSTILACSTRGVFALEADERCPMAVQALPYGSSAKWSSADHHHYKIPSSSSKKKGGVGGNDLEVNDLGTSNGPQMTSSGEAPWIERHEQLFRPDRDLWRSRSYGNQKPLGGAGWALALVFGFEPVEVPLRDVQRLLGLGPKQVQRIVDGLGFSRTSGRGAVVAVDLSYYGLGPAEEEGWFNREGMRANLKRRAAHEKKKAAGRRGTSHGYAAYRIAQNRELVASVVEDRTWRSWVLELDEERLATELEMYCGRHGELPPWARDLLQAHRQHRSRGDLARPYVEALAEEDAGYDREGLRAMALRLVDAEVADFFGWLTEPAEVPDSPEALEPELAADAYDTKRLAAMRLRITEPTTEEKPVAEHPEPTIEPSAEETEDDRVLRVQFQGRADIFRNVHGRLPNQPKRELTPQELKQQRIRREVEERRRSRESVTVE